MLALEKERQTSNFAPLQMTTRVAAFYTRSPLDMGNFNTLFNDISLNSVLYEHRALCQREEFLLFISANNKLAERKIH